MFQFERRKVDKKANLQQLPLKSVCCWHRYCCCTVLRKNCLDQRQQHLLSMEHWVRYS